MERFTFRGGIHPYDGKELSKDKPIRTVLPKGDLAYLLSQHIGAPAVPIVEKGDRVLVGQKIAEAGGFVSSPVHASVSGTVKGIEPRLTVTGTMCNAIIVENDGKYESVDFPKHKPLEELTGPEIVQIIKEAGIVGMGGAGFPTHVKLSPKEPEKIDYIIANCAECEPYLTSDYRRMMEDPDKVVAGMRVILKIFPQAKGIIAVEDNKKDAAEALRKQVKEQDNIEVMQLKTKYPQGAERQLIYATTGRAINSSMLPADAGCIVDNCETVFSIYRAVYEGRPVMHRIVTVTGNAIAQPQNFCVCTGSNYHDLIDEAGGFKENPAKVVSGGPMMGFALYNLDVPTTKTSSALLCLTKDEVAEYEPSACINCGKCVEVCPGRVLPARLADFAERHDEEMFVKYNGMECCECGCCSFICPAKRHLTQSIKSMRKIILGKRKKK
ncbi:MAG: electron transport complex subunit RsxC [Lachnospiraceae bacterium]|nr:electron transport complex subunit RsxC [Lachnospiraceae bacterium]